MDIVNDNRNQYMHSNGSSALETFLIILPSYFYSFITCTLVSLLEIRSRKWNFVLEFCILIMPIILNVTILPKYISYTLTGLFVAHVSLLGFVGLIETPQHITKRISFEKAFITNVRSTINVISVIAILAVDFRVFPRRFAKTETFGFSLMDVGVGLYVFSNGIVAPEVLNRKYSINKTIRNCIPLIILGTIRFFITSNVNYNVPVSEYGVHWNFFITLAVTKLITSIVLRTIDVKYCLIYGIFIAVMHEVLLQNGLQDFVLSNTKRTTFVTANREGIVSSLGYVSLYLFSVYFAHFLKLKNNAMYFVSSSVKFMICIVISGWLAFFLNKNYGTSRRLANTAYCFWILFLGIFMTFLFYLGEVLQRHYMKNKLNFCVLQSYIYDAVNYNGLAFFLFCNLTTGFINLICDTLTFNDMGGLIIIVLYMIFNCLIMCVLFDRQLKLKL